MQGGNEHNSPSVACSVGWWIYVRSSSVLTTAPAEVGLLTNSYDSDVRWLEKEVNERADK